MIYWTSTVGTSTSAGSSTMTSTTTGTLSTSSYENSGATMIGDFTVRTDWSVLMTAEVSATMTENEQDLPPLWTESVYIAAYISSGLLLALGGFVCFLAYRLKRSISLPTVPLGAGAIESQQTAMQSATTYSMQTTSMMRTWVPSEQAISVPGYLLVKVNTDFTIGNQLAKGGMGSIYHVKVLNQQLGRRTMGKAVVLKTVGTYFDALPPKHQRAFTQELALMQKFNEHPNFVKLYGWCDSPAGMIMHFYSGGDLKKFIRGRSRSMVYSRFNTINIMKQICSAVAIMHADQIVHCDLKPPNIMLENTPGNDILAVLGDLGIARILDLGNAKVEAFTVTNVNGLSTPYAAPEVFTRYRSGNGNDTADVWKAGDCFALSIILLEMLKRRNAYN
jgi:hypothetical protein